MSEHPSSPSAKLRDGFAALREFIIVVAMLSLLLVPTRVKRILEDAGIRSLAGVEFDTQTLAESEAEVAKAHEHVRELMAQLNAVQEELTVMAETEGPYRDPGFDTMEQFLANAQQITIETEMNLHRSSEKYNTMLKRLGAKPATPPEEEAVEVDPHAQAARLPVDDDVTLDR